jgi:hypothetical protein
MGAAGALPACCGSQPGPSVQGVAHGRREDYFEKNAELAGFWDNFLTTAHAFQLIWLEWILFVGFIDIMIISALNRQSVDFQS